MTKYGRFVYPTGNYYEGKYKDNKRSGWGKYVRANGEVEEGNFERNKLMGKRNSQASIVYIDDNTFQ